MYTIQQKLNLSLIINYKSEKETKTDKIDTKVNFDKFKNILTTTNYIVNSIKAKP